MSEAELRFLGESFLRQARGADYLTEVALDQAGLKELLRALRNAWWRTEPAIEFALAVAAVNFAYYQEEDEGFREPFLAALTNRRDLNEWQNSIGPRVRRAIQEAGYLVPEAGFQYVGPIRMHAGLSFARLGSYAKVIAGLRADPGWPAVQCAPRTRLAEAVQQHFANSKAAEEFLLQSQGIDFIRATCDVLAMHREGYVSHAALDAQPGFRTGFLARLLELLQKIDTAGPSLSRGAPLAAPRFVLDPESLRLFLRFDPEQVARRAVTCHQLRGRIYRPKMPLGPDLPPSFSFTGTRRSFTASGEKLDVAWETEGWLPRSNDWAVFDEQGRFIASWREKIEIELDAGGYLIVCDARLGLGSRPMAAALGPLDACGLDFDCDYQVYHLDLRDEGPTHDVLPGLRVTRRDRVALRLSAVGGQPWSNLSDLDVIWSEDCAEVPAVDLHGWTAEIAGRYRVMLRVNEHESCLEVPLQSATTGDAPAARILLDKMPAPSLGRLWLQPVGRSSGRHAPVELTFARFPRCTVNAPARLYQEHEVPPITFDVPIVVEIECDADLPQHEANGGRVRVTYASRPGCSVVHAGLRCGQVGIDLTVPVHRARLFERFRPYAPLVLEGEVLRQFHRAHLQDGVAAMGVTALPKTHTTLLLQRRGATVLPLTSKEIGPAGTAELAANEIIDALATCDETIGSFALTEGSGHATVREVPTGSWFVGECVDVTAFQPQDLDELPPRMADSIRLILASQRNEACSCDLVAAAPPRLARLAARWHAAGVAIDGRQQMSGFQQTVDPEVWQALMRIKQLRDRLSTIDGEANPTDPAKAWVEAYDQLDPVKLLRQLGLGLKRWESLLQGERARMVETADTTGRLAAFSLAIRSGEKPPEGVRALLEHAALNYLRAETAQSPRAAQAFLKGATRQLFDLRRPISAPPFWLLIGEGLLPLVFLRQARIGYALGLIQSYPRSGPCAASLQSLAAILSANPASGELVPAVKSSISPRRDDGLIFAAMADPSRWFDAAKSCWLGAWLGWRYAVLAEEGKGVQNGLLQAAVLNQKNIPASLERPAILRELEMGVPASWSVAASFAAQNDNEGA